VQMVQMVHVARGGVGGLLFEESPLLLNSLFYYLI
jgi:hypothetical protein